MSTARAPGPDDRLGLNVPYEWWPASALLKEIEASGFRWVQLPSPPARVLAEPRSCIRHAAAVGASLATTGLRAVLHAPGSLLAGTRESDRALEGALSYAAESGATHLVYHARALPELAGAEDRLLAEARSLAALAATAERLGIVIALENLAPLYPGPEPLISEMPATLRSLAKRIDSPAVGLCLDLGHANVVADLRHTRVAELVEPALDATRLFHLHDNLGARRRAADQRAELDPLKLDLHLAPGRGSLDWPAISPGLLAHEAPLMLEVHPPHRPAPAALFRLGLATLTRGARTAA